MNIKKDESRHKHDEIIIDVQSHRFTHSVIGVIESLYRPIV
jgi:hypothetical protein